MLTYVSWARGQAWGVYGYTSCYRESKDTAFLQQAKDIGQSCLCFYGQLFCLFLFGNSFVETAADIVGILPSQTAFTTFTILQIVCCM